MKKILVIHQGARDGYKVAESLIENGYDVHLLTSAYATRYIRFICKFIPFNGAKKLGRRYAVGVSDKRVFGLFFEEILSRIFNKIWGESYALEWLNKRISACAERLHAKNKYDVVLAYNYNAFSVFNSSAFYLVKKILFQCHPHPLYIKSKFFEFKSAGLLSLKNSEKEFSYSSEYQAMLIAEPFVADKILCASSVTKQSLIFAGIPSESISTVPYGVSSENFDYSSKPDAGVARVIFVGQFVQRKGLLVIKEIIKRLGNDFEWVFVGRGGIDFDVDSLRGLSSNISICWDVSPKKLSELYVSSDIFLFPSLMEGFGHVVLEAMSFGVVPVVSGYTAGLDIIQPGIDGFVIDPVDIDSYIYSLNFLKDKSERIRMASSAIEKVRCYSWENFKRGVFDEV